MEGLNTSDLKTKANLFFTYVFIIEMSLKLFSFGVKGYTKDKMNIFDGLIVIISIVEMVFL